MFKTTEAESSHDVEQAVPITETRPVVLNRLTGMNLASIEIDVEQITFPESKRVKNRKQSAFLISFFNRFKFYNEPIVIASKGKFKVIWNEKDVELIKAAGSVEKINALLWTPSNYEVEVFYYANISLEWKSLLFVDRYKEVVALESKLRGWMKGYNWDMPDSIPRNNINRKMAFILGIGETSLERIKTLANKAKEDNKNINHYLKMIDDGYGINSLEHELGLNKKKEAEGTTAIRETKKLPADGTIISDGETRTIPAEVNTISNGENRTIEVPNSIEFQDDYHSNPDDENFEEELEDNEHLDDVDGDEYEHTEGDDIGTKAKIDAADAAKIRDVQDARNIPIAPLLQMLFDNAIEDKNGNLKLNWNGCNEKYKNIELCFTAEV